MNQLVVPPRSWLSHSPCDVIRLPPHPPCAFSTLCAHPFILQTSSFSPSSRVVNMQFFLICVQCYEAAHLQLITITQEGNEEWLIRELNHHTMLSQMSIEEMINWRSAETSTEEVVYHCAARWNNTAVSFVLWATEQHVLESTSKSLASLSS